MNFVSTLSAKVTIPVMLFTLLLSLFFIAVRGVEWAYATSFLSVEWPLSLFIEGSIGADCLTVISVSVLLLVFQILILPFKKGGESMLKIFWLLISFLYISLTLFYLSSGRLLGNEFFRYRIQENVLILKTGFTWGMFFLMLIFCLLNWLIYRFLSVCVKRGEGNKNVQYVSLGFVFFSVLVWNNHKDQLIKSRGLEHFSNTTEYYVANSKMSYFFEGILGVFSQDKSQKYSSEEINSACESYLLSRPEGVDKEYPFLVDTITTSSLSPYFKKSDIQPNVVIIIVESLSSAFSGTSNYLGTYTPFLDSLSENSLCWVNAISCSERTYGALPNVLGSLPFGRSVSGLINDDELVSIRHSTIISALNKKYLTAFFYPGWDGFDQTGLFMKLNKTQESLSEKKLKEMFPDEVKYAWGYDDNTLFRSGEKYQEITGKPFINVFLTLGIHNPYDHKPKEKSVEDYLKSKNVDGGIRRKEIQTTIFLTDDAIKKYIESFKSKPAYKNTIFIITGDHCIGSDIYLKSPMESFRVPLLIYSPLLKQSKKFLPIVTHRDILPSLVGLLNENYGVRIFEEFSILGNQLDTAAFFQSKVSTSLNIYSDNIPSFVEGDYYLKGDNVYEITDSLMNSKLIENDSIKRVLIAKLMQRKVLNNYVVGENKLIH